MVLRRLVVSVYAASWMIIGAVLAYPTSTSIIMIFADHQTRLADRRIAAIFFGMMTLGAAAGFLISKWSYSRRWVHVGCLIVGVMLAVPCSYFIALSFNDPKPVVPVVPTAIITGVSITAAIGSLFGIRKRSSGSLLFWCLVTLITDVTVGLYLATELTTIKGLAALGVGLVLILFGWAWILALGLVLAGLFGSLHRHYNRTVGKSTGADPEVADR